MAQIPNCEQLFILELLIENLKILHPGPTAELEELPYNFSIKFGCLSCFHISVEEAVSHETENDGVIYKWNTGKSCLFSIKPEMLADMVSSTPLLLVLYQKKSYVPSQSIVGTVQIPLGEDFLKITENAKVWISESPASAITQNRFNISNSDHKVVALVDLSLRLTCQGTSIFTSIQMTEGNKFRFEKDIRPEDHKCKACSSGKILKSLPELNEEAKGESRDIPDDEEKSLVDQPPSKKSTLDESIVSSEKRRRSKIQRHSHPKSKPKRERRDHKESKERRRQSSKKYRPGPEIVRHGVVIGHAECRNSMGPIPAQHGWAWTTTVPEGMKHCDILGWKPGYFHKAYLRNVGLHVYVAKKTNHKNIPRKTKQNKVEKIENPSIFLRKKAKLYEIEYGAPFSETTEKRTFPANMKDSDFEINVQVPDLMPDLPKLRHQAQQFCEEDFPKPKPKVLPKAKKAKKKPGKGNKKQGKDKKKKNKAKKSPKSPKSSVEVNVKSKGGKKAEIPNKKENVKKK